MSSPKSVDSKSTAPSTPVPFIRYIRKGDKKRAMAFQKAEKAQNKEEAIKEVLAKDFQRKPIGVIVAKPVGDKMAFGFSLCCSKDDYSKKRGREIAFGRADKHLKEWEESGTSRIEVPNSIMDPFSRFYTRCQKYFKDKQFPVVVSQPSAPKVVVEKESNE